MKQLLNNRNYNGRNYKQIPKMMLVLLLLYFNHSIILILFHLNIILYFIFAFNFVRIIRRIRGITKFNIFEFETF